MKKKIPSIIIILILILALFTAFDISLELAPTARGATIYVPNDYPTIQEAVDAAQPWDTVYVYSGNYAEHVEINKRITLQGEDKDTTIIKKGSVQVPGVIITASWVSVSGFTFTNGLKLSNVQNCIFSNNIVTDIGLYLESSDGNTISGNICNSNYDGINLGNSDENTITGNDVSSNVVYGIYLGSSNGNEITGNTVLSNDLYGIRLEHSNGNTISSNTIKDNMFESITLYDSDDNIISSNTISGYTFGIWLEGSTGNTLSDNTMTKNSGILIEGNFLEHWNTHEIDVLNTVDGKPVYYWKNQTGSFVPSGAGEIILANCTGVTIKDQKLINSTVGIELGFSCDNFIENTTLVDNIYNIYLSHSNDNIFNNNFIGISHIGFQFHSSLNNLFSNCSFDLLFCYQDFVFYENSHAILLNTTGAPFYPHFNDAISSLIVSWYIHVNVTDHIDNPVPNAKVRIEDNKKGSHNVTFITNGNGIIKWIPVTHYIEKKSGTTIYTPHRITAWNQTLVGYAYPDPTIDHSQYIHIILYNGTLMDLENGWNLVSMSRIQSDINLQTVLQSIEGRYDAVQWYNVTDNNDHWKHYNVLKPFSLNDLDNIDHTMGFWLHIIDPQGTTLLVFGNKPTTNQTITLNPGWNLVGYPSLTSYNRTEGLNNLTFGSEVNSIWTYDAAKQKWEELGETDYFEVGKGYWVHAKTNCIWKVPL